MKVKITLWSGMDVQKRTYLRAQHPLECLRASLEDFDDRYGHPPSDARIKVR